MNPGTLQNFCQIGILVFGVLTAACWYGSYWFGRQESIKVNQNNLAMQKEKFQNAETNRRELNNELVQKIEDNSENVINEIKSLIERNKSVDSTIADLTQTAEKTFEVINFSDSKIFLRNDYSPDTGGFGTWFTPIGDINSTKKFFLADLLGDIDRNRISLYVSENAKLVCKVLTADQDEHIIEMDISSWRSGEPHLLIVQWNVDKKYIELNVDSVSNKKIIPNLKFDRLGPLFLKGTDFEGNFPAKFTQGGPSIVEGLKSIGLKEYDRNQ